MTTIDRSLAEYSSRLASDTESGFEEFCRCLLGPARVSLHSHKQGTEDSVPEV